MFLEVLAFVFSLPAIGLCESWFCYENQVSLTCVSVTHHNHVSKNKVAQSVSKRETKSFFGYDFCVCLTFGLHVVALRGQTTARPWACGSQGSHGGMCSDSESAENSSESRSMDSPTASPGRGT